MHCFPGSSVEIETARLFYFAEMYWYNRVAAFIRCFFSPNYNWPIDMFYFAKQWTWM